LFEVNFTVVDWSGNAAFVVRMVEIVDTTRPVVTVTGSPNMTLEAGVAYVDFGAVASDSLSGNVTQSISASVALVVPAGAPRSPREPRGLAVSGGLDIITGFAPLGAVYEITYSAQDAVGNVGTAMRLVRVQDRLPPTIVVLGPSVVALAVGAEFVDPGAQAMDLHTGTVAVETVVDPAVPVASLGAVEGVFRLSYRAVDATGNTVTVGGRVVSVVAPGADAFAILTFGVTLDATTPDGVSAVAYVASVTVSGNTSISAALGAAGITASHVACDASGLVAGWTVCRVEAGLLMADHLDVLRLQVGVVSVSWQAAAVTEFQGALVAAGPELLPVDARLYLQQHGVEAASMECWGAVCFFTSAQRPVAVSGRRSSGPVVVVETVVVPVPAPQVLSQLHLALNSSAAATVTCETLASSLRVARGRTVASLHVDGCTCDVGAGTCVVLTADPLHAGLAASINASLPGGVQVVGVAHGVGTNGTLAVNATEDRVAALLALLRAGVAPSSMACNGGACVFSTSSLVTAEAVARFDNDSSVGVWQAEVLPGQPAPEPTPGWFAATAVFDHDADLASELAVAQIAGFQGLHCVPSLAFDNASLCTLLLPQPWTDAQVTALGNSTAVRAVGGCEATSLRASLETSVLERIGSSVSRACSQTFIPLVIFAPRSPTGHRFYFAPSLSKLPFFSSSCLTLSVADGDCPRPLAGQR
jgi:hypothetical protein